ncbi:S-adenosyl-L-methionine-dependent methyltransferase [Rhodocollybia butyracea]|uniref:S-adenosyl-L-methionine-dependent methyltransferase n=1 Tax=Rhodocollybia butyracea TaxID=206335 RepID=A0A9P5U5R6_9AGAR|nr:S-adenosyl-L-methionine-dependent methyltransferase [Rhodocollybia butyracea]
MTFAVLRSLHALIGDALDDIERVYAESENVPFDANSPSESLTAHPVVISAVNRIVAAAGQMSATVQIPFLTLCDAGMGFHLPSCLRLLEATHTVEILREAGPEGLHVKRIAEKNGVDKNKLAHILRLLATHHILREVSPDVFANNRLSSALDTGKSSEELMRSPETKYNDTNGISAFVGMWYVLPTLFVPDNPNRFRLERFGKAMTGTVSWEVPGAVLNGFDWQSLPKGSTIVDVGGGIGSTSMLLAHAYSDGSQDDDALGLKFVIQDREVVVDMGQKAWKAKCPELLESGIAQFQVHDFFTPQPIKNAAVFILRVVLHDWPDAFAQRILLRLREAATPDTKLLIADFVLPLACTDNFETSQSEEGGEITGIQGAETKLAPAPLLPNLGKASANVYWMDMTMQCMFNGQERTLREIVSLAHSAGWKVTKVTKAPGSLFGHIVARWAGLARDAELLHSDRGWIYLHTKRLGRDLAVESEEP